MTKLYHKLYLSLGSNLGDKENNIKKAVLKVNELIGEVIRQSALFISEPWGFKSDNNFINVAICVKTMLSPYEVLNCIQIIEKELGRTHKSKNGIYNDRLIDIDILFYDDLNIDEENLKIPHPLMYKRDFVIIPLQEIVEYKSNVLNK